MTYDRRKFNAYVTPGVDEAVFKKDDDSWRTYPTRESIWKRLINRLKKDKD